MCHPAEAKALMERTLELAECHRGAAHAVPPWLSAIAGSKLSLSLRAAGTAGLSVAPACFLSCFRSALFQMYSLSP